MEYQQHVIVYLNTYVDVGQCELHITPNHYGMHMLSPCFLNTQYFVDTHNSSGKYGIADSSLFMRKVRDLDIYNRAVVCGPEDIVRRKDHFTSQVQMTSRRHSVCISPYGQKYTVLIGVKLYQYLRILINICKLVHHFKLKTSIEIDDYSFAV